jgi:nicotinate-nucleotide adenylyltransferase
VEKLIIFGGSFDPIHNGHLRMARGASLLLNADVCFVPSAAPRWKSPSAKKNDRFNMLKIAIEQSGLSSFFISDFEMKKDEVINYTIDTIVFFAKNYPAKKLYLLIGADQVNQFKDWKCADEISKLADVIYVNRDDTPIDSTIVERYKMTKLVIKNIGDVSSTKIRNLQSLDTPSKVVDYIEDNNLYYIEKIRSYDNNERFNHCKQVAHLAQLICHKNKLSTEISNKAYIAGLLHDIGKNYNLEELQLIMKTSFPEYLDIPSFAYHQFAGSEIAQKQFGINDEEILDAIKFHATGKKFMSLLGKIIYCADKIEPTRGFDSTILINECLKNAENGFLKVLEANRDYLISEDKNIYNRLTLDCMDLYLGAKKSNKENRKNK